MEQLPFKQLVKEKFSSLSVGQKKVADYLMDNLEICAFKTAFQIGKNAEVSETTVIRLSYALGFESFSNMQSEIQKQFLLQNKFELENEVVVNDSNVKDTFTKVIESEMNILRNLLEPSNVQEIWKSVDVLINADQVLIVGSRISHVSAYCFASMLGSIRENVNLCTIAGDFFEKFSNLTEKSVVVVFSFPRYAKETLNIANCTKEHGIKLISITDRLLSPIGRISDISLATEENVESGTNSIASVISLLDLIIAGIYERDQKRIQLRLQKLEKLYSNYDVFIE